MPDRFNPLDPDEIAQLLRRAIEGTDLKSFPPAPFAGAGLYALYYVGDLGVYAGLAATDSGVPIYVGKAEAGNSSYGFAPDYTANKLQARVAKHARSVGEVEAAGGNLRVADFRVRVLSLEDAWIVLGERGLLRSYRPVLWNTIISGFGSNEPGTARNNARSVWDTIHPGRPRAGPLPNRYFTLDEMLERIRVGTRISLMKDPDQQRLGLNALNARRPPVIWAPAKKSDVDKRLKVAEPRRFRSELERMNVPLIEGTDYVVTSQPLPVSQVDEDDEDG